MIEACLPTGRRADAEELFTQLTDTAGPTGLLPEEYDPTAGRSLGNHPQAYSHLGLIRSAQLLAASWHVSGAGVTGAWCRSGLASAMALSRPSRRPRPCRADLAGPRARVPAR
jgi:hypothetical protein